LRVRPRRPQFWCFLLLLSLSTALAGQPRTAEPPSEAYRRLVIEATGVLSEQALEQFLLDLRSPEGQPELVLVLMHGYDMGAQESARVYQGLAQSLRRQLEPQRVEVIGVQWDSGGGAFDYFATLRRARSLGRGPVRQLLAGLDRRYPNIPVAMIAHSMGCEIALAALVPEMVYGDNEPEGPVWQGEQELRVALAVWLAADLDYDVFSRSAPAAGLWFERCLLTWSTLSDPGTPGDRVLSLRARLRGKAMGALMPRLSERQLDSALPAGRLYLDSHAVPSNHELEALADGARLSALAGVISYLTTSEAPEPPELASMRQALQAPAQVSVLRPWLDSRYAGAAFAALWRLEHLNCGSAHHLADGTLHQAVALLADRPQAVWREQSQTDCVTMRLGLFPSPATMTRAGAPEWARPSRYALPR
jgi:hypothetical protein